MVESEIATEVSEALALDREEFDRRAREEGEALLSAIDDGAFDNPQAIVGLEYEFYGVTDFGAAEGDSLAGDDGEAALRRVPRWLLELIGFESEIGLHNAELSTSPQPLNRFGLAAQRDEVRARVRAALAKTRAEGIRLVSDGLWTIPPVGESAREYLTDHVVDDGVVVGTNLSKGVRYHAFANADYGPRLELDAPNVGLRAEVPTPESVITSIQPHYQVPHAPDLPEHFRYALRAAAPLLALGVNSPLYPPELYDDVPPETILAEGRDEERIHVFESVLNPRDGPRKVRFPRDVETVAGVVERLVEDPPAVPMEAPEKNRFDDRFAHLRHKHGTFWRWIRPVFEGASRAEANARIEFRPIPAQPTIRDAIAFQAAFAGLMESLPRREHPVADLDWETARENFYAAARDGLDAELRWITADGRETVHPGTIYGEVFEYARDGLELRGIPRTEAEEFLRPLRVRFRRRTTPADWKRERVRERLAEGTSFEEAVYDAQREYVRRQADSLLGGSFADWLRED